jgi:nitroreductase
MDVSDAIRARRSLRRFADEAVDRDVLRTLVEAACWAPTAGNAQAWRFVVVTDPERMRKLRMVAPGMSGRPPAAIAVCIDRRVAEAEWGAEIDELSAMDAAMAAENILLEAQGAGLGTCVVASFNAAGLRRLLKLPEHVAPLLLVAVGHPKASPKAPPRDVDAVCSFEEYRERP